MHKKKVIKEIMMKFQMGKIVNRLIQGDEGVEKQLLLWLCLYIWQKMVIKEH